MNVGMTSPGNPLTQLSRLGSIPSGNVIPTSEGSMSPVVISLIPRVLQFDSPDFTTLKLGIMGKPHIVGLVDGGKVKLLHDMEFNEGSNYLRYANYCPQYQMWVDSNLRCPQRKFKALHEIMEVIYLLTRNALSFEEAHKMALADERLFRIWDANGRPQLQ